jgi:mono/diheme cytochrome c family protein
MKISKLLFGLLAVASIALWSCGRSHDDRGWEFAPNMYHSRAYEPLTQWRKNKFTASGMNMREPVKGTIARRNFQTTFGSGDSAIVDLMNYNLLPDSIEYSERVLKNPVPLNEQTIAEGKELYEKNCVHCHGEAGAGDGLVGVKYKGVPNYTSDALKDMNDGHVYHVITYGRNRMWAHASQITPIERWKIVHYVHKLQRGE